MPALSGEDVAWFWHRHAEEIMLLILILSVSCVTYRICAWVWSKPSAPPPGTPVHPERAARVRLRSPLWWLLDLPAFAILFAVIVFLTLNLLGLVLQLVGLIHVKGISGTGIFETIVLVFFVSASSYVLAFGQYLPHRPLSPEERAAAEKEWKEMLITTGKYNDKEKEEQEEMEEWHRDIMALNDPDDLRSPFYRR